MKTIPECGDKTVRQAVTEIVAKQAMVDEMSKRVTDLNKQIEQLNQKIKDWMEAVGLDSFTAEGHKVVLKPEVRGIVQDPLAFFEHLAQKGDDELVRLKLPPVMGKLFKEWARTVGADVSGIDIAIQWNSLAKYVRENCDVTDAATWPDGVDVQAWDRVVVK